MNTLENNIAAVTGVINSPFWFSHEVLGEGFYEAVIKTDRTSEASDKLVVMVSDRLIDITKDYTGKTVRVDGQFRSYNEWDGERKKLILTIFARDWQEIEDAESKHINEIYLDGVICKAPTYRKTPLGREISDVILAINGPYGRSDYIPCILWGRNARFTGKLEVGTHVTIEGRMQSREYHKKIGEDIHTMVAYEVSGRKIDVVEESEG